jgi:hypothetical protein
MYALAEDSRNDVASNIVALACGLIGIIHFPFIHNRDNQMTSFEMYWLF